MAALVMYRDNTRLILFTVLSSAVVPIPIVITGATLYFTLKNANTWRTDPDSAAFLQLSTVNGGVVITPTGTLWAGASLFSANAKVSPTVNNGLFYTTVAGGTSGSSEPAWPLIVGASVLDGTVTWVCVGPVGQATATILPAATSSIVDDTMFQYDWKLKDASGVVSTLELGTLQVLSDVTRT